MRESYFKKDIRVPEGWYLDKESVREGITEDGYEFFYYTLIKSAENICKPLKRNKPAISASPPQNT